MSDKRIGIELTEEMHREFAWWCKTHQGATKEQRKAQLCEIYHRNRYRNKLKQNETNVPKFSRIA